MPDPAILTGFTSVPPSSRRCECHGRQRRQYSSRGGVQVTCTANGGCDVLLNVDSWRLRGYVAHTDEGAAMKLIPDLILELQRAPKPQWRLNSEIALAIGYRKKRAGDNSQKVVWLHPEEGAEVTRVPNFTGSLDGAQILARTLVPDCTGGFTWSSRSATAKINDGPIFTAATPALALCAAALSAKHFNIQQKSRDQDNIEKGT